MAEDKRANPYPFLTAAEFEAAEGTREQKAARCIAARRFGGIPTRAFLLGDNDHSPMMKGVLELTTTCYALLDAWEAGDEEGFRDRAEEMRTMLEDHGCPTSLES